MITSRKPLFSLPNRFALRRIEKALCASLEQPSDPQYLVGPNKDAGLYVLLTSTSTSG
jgi:hypothetical protein